MTKKFIGDPQAVPLTQAIQCGPMLFLSGQVPVNEDGSIPEGIAAQTDLVLRKLGAVAAKAGYTHADFVKTTVFLRNAADFDEMNEVYRKFFPSNFPTRSCILAPVVIAADIEIEAIAMKAD
jgi:2-iminobutanoate/2-iminopropanoate deaminase